jgi:hypothetical protein
LSSFSLLLTESTSNRDNNDHDWKAPGTRHPLLLLRATARRVDSGCYDDEDTPATTTDDLAQGRNDDDGENDGDDRGNDDEDNHQGNENGAGDGGKDGEDDGGIITAAAPPTIAASNCSWGGTGNDRTMRTSGDPSPFALYARGRVPFPF